MGSPNKRYKSAASVIKAFENIISDRIPKTLWVDEGKEFYNATFKKLLQKHKIDMYSTFNEGKAVVIEQNTKKYHVEIFYCK